MKLLYLALAMLVAICPEARAAGGDAFGTVTSKGIELFNNVKTVVFVMGGFGLVGMAVGAVFGKVNWNGALLWLSVCSFWRLPLKLLLTSPVRVTLALTIATSVKRYNTRKEIAAGNCGNFFIEKLFIFVFSIRIII